MKRNSTETAQTKTKSPVRDKIPTLQREENQFAVTIKKSPAEVYSFWRDFTNLPQFMKGLSKISVLGETRTEWTVTLKAGPSVTWEAETTIDLPGEMIGWRSVESSQIHTEGRVRFVPAPAGKGTVVLLSMNYSVPGGKVTELLTMLSGEDPRTLVLTNLHRLKSLLETGEIPTTEGQPSGREPLELH